MNKIAAWLGCLWLGLVGVATAGEPNEFKMAIEGEACVVRAYEDERGISLLAWFDAKPQPLPRPWQLAILCHKSNVTTFLNNEEIRALYASPLSDEVIEKMRAGSKKRSEMTKVSAPDNPWKRMTQTLDNAFVIESSKGKFLLYQTTAQLTGKDPSNGRAWGALKWVDGEWKLGKTELEPKSLTPVSDEFSKLKADGKIHAAPLDSLR